MLLMHSFVVLRMNFLGPSQKLTSSSVTNVIFLCQIDISFCPGSGVFKVFAGNVPFRAIIGTGKILFRATKHVYAIKAIKHVF